MKVFLILMLAMVVVVGGVAAPAMGQYDKEFTGNVSTLWGVGGNWSPAVVPTPTDSVLIPSPKTCLIDNDGSDAVAESNDIEGTLTIDNGRKLTVTVDSAVKAGGLLEISGTLTISAELTIEATASGSAGEVRLHRKITGLSSVINGTGGFITVDGGTVPGLLGGAGTVEIVVYNSGKVQAGGNFPDIFNPLRFTSTVDGSSANSEFWSTYGTAMVFDGGVSGGGKWETPTCQGAGNSHSNGFGIGSASCVSANIVVPRGGLSIGEDFCTTGTLTTGNDIAWCISGIGVAAGKAAYFHVAACPATVACP